MIRLSASGVRLPVTRTVTEVTKYKMKGPMQKSEARMQNRDSEDYKAPLVAALNRSLNGLLKKCEEQVPRGLRPARNDKNKEPSGM